MEAPSVVAKAVCVLGAACETGAAKAVCTPGAACAEKPSVIPRKAAIIATTRRGQRLFPTVSPEPMSSLSRWWYWHYFTAYQSNEVASENKKDPFPHALREKKRTLHSKPRSLKVRNNRFRGTEGTPDKLRPMAVEGHARPAGNVTQQTVAPYHYNDAKVPFR